MHYWLFEYFRGFNLTFSYNVNENLDDTKNTISVTQGLNLINSTKFIEPVDEVIDVSSFEESDGSGYNTLLVRKGTDYKVWYGKETRATTPEFVQVV